jgi:hypothetical protein
VKKILGLALVVPLFLTMAAVSALGIEGDANSGYDFQACVQNEKSGSVVILMDESGSIYGDSENEGSDPRNLRITGAQILIDDLQRVAEETNSGIKVQLSGLGDRFVSRTNGWVNLNPADAAPALALKDTAFDAWSVRSSDNNYRETDIMSSLFGAQETLQPELGCKLLVVFKDGKDWQYFNPTDTQPVEFPKVQQAISQGDFIAAKQAAIQELCRPKGIADGLRSSGVSVLAVALGSGSFTELKDLVSGDNNCGEQPGVGSTLNALDPEDLPSLFKRALNPTAAFSDYTGSFGFEMNNDLQAISILASGLGAPGEFQVRPPQGCSAEITNESSANNSGTLMASSVLWQSRTYGSGDTIQVILQNSDRSDPSCWSGEWFIETGNSNSKSILEVQSNLQATAAFADEDVYLIPGSETPTQFAVNLQNFSQDGEIGLSEGSDVSVAGYLLNDFNQQFANFNLKKQDLGQLRNLSVPADLAFGTYKFVLLTELNVAGLEVKPATTKWERDIEVRGEIASPVILNAPINFGDIDGGNSATATLQIENRSDKELRLEEAVTILTEQGPEGVEYKVELRDTEQTLAANEVTEVELRLAATQDEVDEFGAVSGGLVFDASVVGAEDKSAPFSGDFYGVQKASVDMAANFLLNLIFLIIAFLVTIAAVAGVNYLASRFPKANEVGDFEVLSLPVSVTSFGIQLDSGELSDRIYRDDWGQVGAESRRSVQVGDYSFKAKSPGVKLSGEGFGLIQGTGFSWGSESANLKQPAHIGLALQGQYFVTTDIDQQDISKMMAEQGSFPAVIHIITSDRARTEQIFSNASMSPMLGQLANPIEESAPKREKKVRTKSEGRKNSEPEDQNTDTQEDLSWG